MPNPRVLLNYLKGVRLPVVTYQPRDDQYLGSWSKPDVPVLIYDGSDDFFATHQHRNHGGAIAGAAGGHPVQLIYWGDWWLTQEGRDQQRVITPAIQRMLSSPYWSCLEQYGIPHAPVWRGAFVCTKKAPPTRANMKDVSQQVVDIVQDLIDDDKLPDPDDGPRICHVVLMPKTFTLDEPNIAGAHRSYDKDFPFDGDRFWAGWAKHHEDAELDETVRTICHEVTEMLVDPECNAWRWVPIDSTELRSELCDGSESQQAFVNDARVQAYWSATHNAPIIPIDRDYRAQLHVRVRETGRREVDHGPFAPSNDFCRPNLPDCCFGDRHFEWHAFHMASEARINLNSNRFKEPAARWSINGTPITSSGQITVEVDLETYVGLTATIASAFVRLDCTIESDPPRLRVAPIDVVGNFSVIVGCEVTDNTIIGAPVVNVIATPHVTVGFRGAEALVDDAYRAQLGRCLNAMVRRYTDKYRPSGKIQPDEGINWVSDVLAMGLPAHVTLSQYEQVLELARAVRAANHLFGRDAGAKLMKPAMELLPTLGAVARRESIEKPR